MEIFIIISLVLLLISSIIIIILLVKNNAKKDNSDYSQTIHNSVGNAMNNFSTLIKNNFDENARAQQNKIEGMTDVVKTTMDGLNNSVKSSNEVTEKRLNEMADRLAESIRSLQNENSKKLDEMRGVVDEKLQKTLEDRISKSFETVSNQLQEVYKAIGEMRTLASGVDSLQKVLTNVKTKGILGEIQLGAILEEILAPEQYETNVRTKKGSIDPVEFAIKLPGTKDEPIYLPIDSKFPLVPYNNLIDAYDSCDKEAVERAKKVLKTNITNFAKDIASKYIDVPNTTEFAIMFLPVEGLYAEVVKLDLISELQAKYKINIAGPSTMAALLNSLQMGFKTLAIQKRSAEVWNILSGVKTEFENFEKVLTETQTKMDKVQEGLELLVGTRTRKINAKLKGVTTLPEIEARQMFDEVNE